MRLHGKLTNLSHIVHKLFHRDKIKPQRSETQDEVLSAELAKLLQPKPPRSEEEEIPQQTSSTLAGDSTIVGTKDKLADSLVGTFPDVELDPGNLEPLAVVEDPGENNNQSDTHTIVRGDSSFALYRLYQEHSLADGDAQAANGDGDDGSLSSPTSSSSLDPDMLTITIDKPLLRTPEPDVCNVEHSSPDPSPRDDDDATKSVKPLRTSLKQYSVSMFIIYGHKLANQSKSSGDLDNTPTYLMSKLPSPSMDIGIWTKEMLEEYKVNPGLDTSFRQFVHRQRVVEWRRYQVKRTFVAAPHRGEYMVVKVQDATETRFLYLDRVIMPKDADLWQKCDKDWLKRVEDEGRLGPGIDTRVTVTRKGQEPAESDLRLIWGLWTPCDRIMMLQGWPHNHVERERHVFEPNDQPDLLDLLIAARMVHLDTSFSMFQRQDHWFTKMLSRVLNQKWDKYDQLSVADKNKFDKKCNLQNSGKWNQPVPVTDLRHDEVLKLREHCNNWRDKLVFVTNKIQNQQAKDLDAAKSRDANSTSRLSWGEDKLYILQQAGRKSGPSTVTTAASASKLPPAKSSLKVKHGPDQESLKKELQRLNELQQLEDNEYLIHPVKTIVEATDATELRVLIKAYSVITQRLQGATTDSSLYSFLPEFQEYRTAFVEAIVRDLSKTFRDLATGKEEKLPVLPSSIDTLVEKNSKKKWVGMSAEQVKDAWGMSLMSHAIIRLLWFMLTKPTIMSIFHDVELRSMFETVLATLLRNDLLYPRKSRALALNLIVTQRLSAAVLAPFVNHISLALYCSINDDFGKGNFVRDGLMAVHHLSIRFPAVFIPSFTRFLLPTVLALLFSRDLNHRCFTAFALTGFVAGAASIPNAPIHATISNIVLEYIMSSPPGVVPPPTKAEEPYVFWALCALLQVNSSRHPASGPVWAVHVLFSFIVLLGPAATHVPDLRKLVTIGMMHGDSFVRALMTVMWRCILWVYVCPPLITADKDGKEEVNEREIEREAELRDEWWKVLASTVKIETGVCVMAAMIGTRNGSVPCDLTEWVNARFSAEDRNEQHLRRALELLCMMAEKDALTRESAVFVMEAMVGVDMPQSSTRDNVEAREHEKVWTLVPRELFSVMPMTRQSFNRVIQASHATPKAGDVRMLTQAEMGKMWVWDGIVKAWKVALGASIRDDWQKQRKRLFEIWKGMYSMGLKAAIQLQNAGQDETNHEAVSLIKEFVDRAIDVIIAHVLENAEFGLQSLSFPSQDGPSCTGNRVAFAIARLGLARDMWRFIRQITSRTYYGSGPERLAECLMRNVEEYTMFGNPASKAARIALEQPEDEEKMDEAWVEFCLDVACCDRKVLWSFRSCLKSISDAFKEEESGTVTEELEATSVTRPTTPTPSVSTTLLDQTLDPPKSPPVLHLTSTTVNLGKQAHDAESSDDESTVVESPSEGDATH